MAGHTMDFFAYQDQARRKTGLLVLYFLLAVLLIVGAVHAAIVILLAGAGPEGTALARWRPDLLPAIAGATLAIIGLGTLYKIASLARGGEAVASLLGGRPIAGAGPGTAYGTHNNPEANLPVAELPPADARLR